MRAALFNPVASRFPSSPNDGDFDDQKDRLLPFPNDRQGPCRLDLRGIEVLRPGRVRWARGGPLRPPGRGRKATVRAPWRAPITEVVRKIPMKILVCPEDMTQMAVGKELISDKLPEDVRRRGTPSPWHRRASSRRRRRSGRNPRWDKRYRVLWRVPAKRCRGKKETRAVAQFFGFRQGESAKCKAHDVMRFAGFLDLLRDGFRDHERRAELKGRTSNIQHPTMLIRFGDKIGSGSRASTGCSRGALPPRPDRAGRLQRRRQCSHRLEDCLSTNRISMRPTSNFRARHRPHACTIGILEYWALGHPGHS